MKPVAIDLFCGKGGWTNGLLEAGFEVYGCDIEPQPDYKGTFIECDILELNTEILRRLRPSFGTCSSPCEQFSVHGIVRSAEKFVGKAVNHCGPFYFWGNAVPAVFPPECYRVTKSLEVGSSQALKNMDAAERKAYRKQFPILQQGSKSPERKAVTAAAAMIPLPIARAVAEAAWNLTQALEVA